MATPPLMLPSTAPKYPGTSIGPVTPAMKTASDKRVTDARAANLTKVNAQNADLSWWNPWGYVTGAWKAKKAANAMTAPITSEDRMIAEGAAMRPLIERELEEKYAPAIAANDELRKRALASIPQTKLQPGTGTSGQGANVLQNKPGPTSPAAAALSEATRTGTKIAKAKKQEAQDLEDAIVIENLQAVIKRPLEVGGVKVGKMAQSAVRGLTLGVFGTDKRDPRLIEAERRNFTHVPERESGMTGTPGQLLESAPEFAAMFVPYYGLEMGSVKIGNALRTVKKIDSFYQAYPYLARTTAANLGTAVGDAAIRTASGQDYTAKDFLLNVGMQGVFDKALGSSKVRILAHLDNESRALEKSLGRAPQADEVLQRIAPMKVPGTSFTYGNWFAEHRMAYRNGDQNFLGRIPSPEAERRLTYLSGIDPSTGGPRKGTPGIERPALSSLEQEAKQYKTAEEFVAAKMYEKPKYGMQHRPTFEGSPPAYDLLEGDMLPRDVYDKPEWSIASGRDVKTDAAAKESWEAIQKIRGNPEAEIVVYRASPKNELNPGDWVSFSKTYAEGEGAYEGSKAYAHKVKAKDIFFAGDDINEFGYLPKSQFTEAWNRAQSANLSSEPTVLRAKSGESRMPGIRGDDNLKMPWEEGAAPAPGETPPAAAAKPALTGDMFPTMSDDELTQRLMGIQQEIDGLQSSMNDMPDMTRYANRKTGELPEVTGKGRSEFARTGDDIASKLGFADSEELRASHLTRSEIKKELLAKKTEMRDLRAEYERRGGTENADIPYVDIPRDSITAEEIPGLHPEKMSTEGARRALILTMEENPDLLLSRTRGVVSDADAVEKAADLGITKDYLLRMPVGHTLNKEEMTAARMLVSAHGEDVAKLGKTAAMEAIGNDGAYVQSTGVQKEYMRALLEHAQLQSVLRGFSAEAGRSLQSLKQNVSPLKKLQNKFFDLLTNADVKQTEALTKQASRIDINDPDQVLAFIRKNVRFGWLDMVAEGLTAIKLTAPTTHIVNMTSNGLYNIAIPIFRLPVAGVDMARAAITKTPRERFAREALSDVKGMLGRGAKQAFNVPVSDIAGYLKTKYTPFSSPKTAEAEAHLASIRGTLGETWKALLDESYTPGGNVEDAIRKVPAIKGNTGNRYIDTAVDITGKTIRLPFRLLNAEDVAMRTMARSGELHVLATREAMMEGLKGEAAVKRMYEILENPPLEMLEQAERSSATRVFQQPMGRIASAVNTIRGMPVVGPLTKIFILPFLKTGANIIKTGYRAYNPADFMRGIKAGGGEASESIARTSIATLSAIGLMQYVLDGTITGSAPQDLKLREELYNKGWQPYSIRIGDRYFAFDRMEPLQQTLRIIAAIGDAYKKTGEVSMEMTQAAVMDILAGTLDRSYIRGMNDLANAAFNPDRYGESFFKRYIASQPIPAISRSFTSLTDTDAQGRPIVRDTETLTEYAKSQIPGMAPGLKPRLDSSGRPVVRRTGALEYVFSPVRSTKAEVSKGEIEKMITDFRAMKKLAAEDRETNAEMKNAALVYIAELAQIPIEARVQNMQNLKKTNPDLAAEVSAALKRRKTNFTFQDETLLSLTVNARADYMLEAIKAMPKDQRAAQVADWKKKKIMTTAVEKQFKLLIAKSKKPSTSSSR